MERITSQSWLGSLLRRVRTALTIALVLRLLFPPVLVAEDTGYPGPKRPDLNRPGQLVEIGTHALHIYCRGEGGPPVIIDSGLGSLALEWYDIQGVLARYVQTCIYDRAGYGWSRPGPQPRTSSRIVEELYLLLKTAQIPGPYVLVGHSFGGYNMQLFASRYPGETAGLVLVDSSHADQIQRFSAPPIKVRLVPVIKGKYTITQFTRPTVHPAVPAKLKGIINMLLHSPALRQAMASEFMNFDQSALEVKISGALPAVPLVVLTRGKRVWPEGYRGDLMEKLWFELQGELASRSTHYVQFIASKSGHYIHLDQPRLVIDAIKQVLYTFNYQERKPVGLHGLKHIGISRIKTPGDVQFCATCDKF